MHLHSLKLIFYSRLCHCIIMVSTVFQVHVYNIIMHVKIKKQFKLKILLVHASLADPGNTKIIRHARENI